MRSGQYLRNLKAFASAAVFTAAAVVVLDGSAHAQRGKGGGKNGGGPPGHQKQMSRPQWGGGGQVHPGGGQQRQKQWNGNNPWAQQQQIRVQRVPRQQEIWKVQRQQAHRQQQQMNAWIVRQQRQNTQQQRQAQWAQQMRQVQRQAIRQQHTGNGKEQRRQERRWANWNQTARRQTQWNDRETRRVPRGRGQVYDAPVRIGPGGFAWTGRQWGHANAEANRYRRDLKHAWKDERKAQRRFEKEQRRYSRDRNTTYSFNNYGNYANTYYVDDDGYDRTGWRNQLLRTVIGRFVGTDDRYYGSYDAYDDRRYERPGYYSEDVPRYYSSPIYVGYTPDYSNEAEYYYSDYGYDEGDRAFDLGGIMGQLPIQELISSFAGDGFVSQLLGNLLVQGYDEGYLAGQAAREYGFDDSDYDNPYVFEGGFCDPYSASIGDNRQLLGEGYALGYRDALSGRDDYDPYSDGQADLVSTLLSGVLGRV